MARQYSTINFFRQMPNALLARYFQGEPDINEIADAVFKRLREGVGLRAKVKDQ
jgi:hypothetical protein